ncbi:hypothetical protein LINPERPRIM_LOCUS32264 [Linum perenne]
MIQRKHCWFTANPKIMTSVFITLQLRANSRGGSSPT